MGMEGDSSPPDKSEAEFCSRFEKHLIRMQREGRCEWRKEVRLLIWRHAADNVRKSVRIDYVASFDGGPLVGIEAKRAPRKARDIGHYLKQCADYSNAIIAGHVDTPQQWVGKPLLAVFLAVEIGGVADYIAEHYRTAHRLFGAFNVGFVRRHGRAGIQLTLSDETNFWCEGWGYRTGVTGKVHRAGHTTFRPQENQAAADEEIAQIFFPTEPKAEVEWWDRK